VGDETIFFVLLAASFFNEQFGWTIVSKLENFKLYKKLVLW